MITRKSKRGWFGDSPDDLDPFLIDSSTTFDGAPVARVEHARCAACGSTAFAVRLDDDEGWAERRCVGCGDVVQMLDSGDLFHDLESAGEAACPCGHEEFEVAVGFSLMDHGEVRWVFLGLRCLHDGLIGCYAEWSIDYEPSTGLFTRV